MVYNIYFSLMCLQVGYSFAQLCLAALGWAPGCGLGSSLFHIFFHSGALSEMSSHYVGKVFFMVEGWSSMSDRNLY